MNRLKWFAIAIGFGVALLRVPAAVSQGGHWTSLGR